MATAYFVGLPPLNKSAVDRLRAEPADFHFKPSLNM
jgi:hypothetical protein